MLQAAHDRLDSLLQVNPSPSQCHNSLSEKVIDPISALSVHSIAGGEYAE
jgi:hypothetical protein